MVRQARQMIADGDLGKIRLVQLEYAQDWLATPLEEHGAETGGRGRHRTRRKAARAAASATSARTLTTSRASSQDCIAANFAADVSIFVPGRRLDDNVQLMLRFAEGAKGALWASQVATRERQQSPSACLRRKSGLEWHQEEPNDLLFARLGEAPEILRPSRSLVADSPRQRMASRIPGRHPEGYLEAFAQLYTDLAIQIYARR